MTTALPFVGRAKELELLQARLDDGHAGQGSCVLLLGEPGIGKSRLAEQGAARAREAGFTVAWGRCWEAGGAPEYWPWIQVLRGLVGSLPGPRLDALAGSRRALLARLLPELGDSPGPGDGVEAGSRHFELLDGVASWMLTLAREGPVWIGLEDLHAADAASLELLELLSMQVRAAPIVVVGTAREHERRLGPAAERFSSIERSVTSVVVPRLESAAVDEFLSRAFEERLSATDRAKLEARAEGHPLFLVELTRLFRVKGPKARVDELLPPTIQAAVQSRLRALTPGAARILAQAALIGREFSTAALREAFGLEAPELGLREATEAALVEVLGEGRWRFSHGHVPEVLSLETSELLRAEGHAAYADWLADRGAGFAERAHHLLLAGPKRRPDAIAACLEAGREAHASLAFEDALVHFGRARELLPPGEGRLAWELDLCEGASLIAAGEGEQGRQRCWSAFVDAADAGDGQRMAEAALAYGSEFEFAGIDPRLIEALEQALEALDDERSPVAARLLGRLAAARQPAADPSGPIAQARRAIEIARACGDEEVLVDVLRTACSAMVDLVGADERLGYDLELYRHASRRDLVLESLRALGRLIFDEIELGQLDAAWAHVDEACALIRERAPARLAWQAPSLRATRALWEGRLEDAEAEIEAAHQLVQGTAGELSGGPGVVRVFQLRRLHRLRDDEEALAALGPEVLKIYSGSELGRALAKIYYAEVLAWLGRVEELRALVDAEMIRSSLSFGDWTSVASLAEIAAALEDRELGEELLHRLDGKTGRLIHTGISGRTIGDPIERIMALAARAAGQSEAALTWLDAAVESCLRGRATGLAERIRKERARWQAELGEQASRSKPATLEREAPRLRCEGATWRVEFGGRSSTVKASKGVEMIARLLEQPQVEVHVLDLVHPDGGRARVDEGDAGELLDAEARAAYEARSRELGEELREAEAFNDLARAERLRAELDALAGELSRAFGLSGRSRRAGKAAERARVNVRKRIRHAFGAIAAVDPELGRYLEATIETGLYCRFQPL